jgi:hypothetical protein
MGIHVNEVGNEDLPHVGIVEHFGDLLRCDAGRRHGIHIVNFDIGHIFERQDGGGAEIVIDEGHIDMRLCREIGGKAFEVFFFLMEIEFGAGGADELFQQHVQIHAQANLAEAFEPARRCAAAP